MIKERWRRCPIKGYQRLYKVSDQGRVMHMLDYQLLSSSLHNGCYAVTLRINRKTKRKISVARLVLMTWEPIDSPRSYDVEWKNGDKSDNRLANLGWIMHRIGEKFTAHQVREIRARAAQGEGAAALGFSYSVTEKTINDIVNRATYTHVEDIDG